jgi:fermentation-respiration switch protein FrsA (DUF1100 family)
MVSEGANTPRRGLKRLGAFVAVVVVAALAWMAVTVVLLWSRQERIVFQPPAHVPEAPSVARRVEFPASDGHPIFGFVVEPTAGSREPATVVLAFHGNADLSAWFVPWARELAERTGATVFLPEYRGYGGIPGRPTYTTASADARGALDWARRTYPAARIVLFGHSLGSAIATELAEAMAPAGPATLVLQSPFTSAQAMAARMLVPPIPGLWSLISRVHYDTRRVVASLDVPVWVSHGTRDVVIPIRMGRAVFAAARRPGELLVVDRAGHNDVADVGGAEYWRWLTSAVGAR